MIIESLKESEYADFIDNLLKQTLKEAISSPSDPLGHDPFIPMAFVDYNCMVILKACLVPQTFESAGNYCVHAANKSANLKYGENKAKLMEQIGVISIDFHSRPHKLLTTKFGNYLLSLNKSTAEAVMIRLLTRIPVIQKLLSGPNDELINVASVFPNSYSQSTIKRRSSSIIHIIRDIEKEFQVKGYSKRIVLDVQDQIKQAKRFGIEELPSEPGELSQSTKDEHRSESTPLGNKPETIEDVDPEDVDPEDVDPRELKEINQDSNNKTGQCMIQYCPPVLKIRSFLSNYYTIDSESKISGMLESLINIIDDPLSEYITQTLAYLPLGYLVKYGQMSKESVKETECACFLSLMKIYELNMNLMIYNLSNSFQLSDFYKIREKYISKYAIVIESVKKRLCIDEFFNKTATEASSQEYLSELTQLHISEANLYYRLAAMETEFLDEESYIRCLQIISQSRLEYPLNGLAHSDIPILEKTDLNSPCEQSIKDCIFSEINNVIDPDKLSILWNYEYDDWHESINELLLLSYVLSPHRIIDKNNMDILYVACQSIVDKSNYFDDDGMQHIMDRLYNMIISELPGEKQIRIMNRVNSILISNYLSIDLITLSMNIQDDIVFITNVCHSIDRESGRQPKYKSRFGIESTLTATEKNEIRKICEHRDHTDSERSRQNRFVNRLRYDYDDE